MTTPLSDTIPTPSALRAELERLVLADLLGPAGGVEEEITENSVRDRYLIGMLAPARQQFLPEMQDDLANGADADRDEGPADIGVSQKPSLMPSSLGLTFCAASDASTLQVRASWGQYLRIKSETLTTEKTGQPQTVWRRQPRGGAQTVALVAGDIAPFVPDPEQPDVVVQGRVRQAAAGWLVTLFLVNKQDESKTQRDMCWIFQPELMVVAPDGGAIFCQRTIDQFPHTGAAADLEARQLAMRYRDEVEFAVGHGISVVAETAAHDPTSAFRLTTVVAPVYEVPRTIAPSPADLPQLAELAATQPAFGVLADLVVDMQRLSETPNGGFGVQLGPLLAAYGQWITAQAARGADPAARLADFSQEAAATIATCRDARDRIAIGIALLDSNPQAADAFRFMNHAMWQQRVHTLIAETVRRGQTLDIAQIDVPRERSWRPFQLAFILLNLPALTDLHHHDRGETPQALADLLFFPTGGGKTEAYLGLTAYTLGIRRLQGSVAGRSGLDGVAVLMRYTLRLLTLQQFQRATTLICACEVLRRADPLRWGTTPFRLGLWVGQRTTPNTAEQSAEAIKRDHGQFQRGSTIGGSGTPAQLTNCPWCGTAINPGAHIIVETATGRTTIYCGDPRGECPFSRRQAEGEGIPALVVDSDIYRRLPALLIATVDKFAQLPWNGRTAMLFGQVDGYCPRHGFTSPEIDDDRGVHRASGGHPPVQWHAHPPLRPPDLIIQDELHLISGPLGTLVGLYESAIDHLCTWTVDGRRVRPKVIASTATVRRAADQMHALFLRKVAIFPPPGLDATDSFFAVQRPATDAEPGRRYLGICAIGRRQKAALIRVYVAFLGAAQLLYEQYGTHADPWQTLVGYFNAMRELGGMRRLVEDDVRSRLQKIDQRGLRKRGSLLLDELTSRKGATDIPRILDLLEVRRDPVDDAQREQARKARQPFATPQPLDVLLATNMISVGVDVKRLGLMVVSGQPKTTAEYIQASSRVGRTHPGLVCTIFNWARPRDLSHYEQFGHYHATFYQQVESLSVTPFSPQALHRGLAGLLIALVRLQGDEFNANDRAGRVESQHAYVRETVRLLAERAQRVTGRQDVATQVTHDLTALLDTWQAEKQRMQAGARLGYRRARDGLTVPLLKSPERGGWSQFTVLNSLRDVEPPVGLVLDDRTSAIEHGVAFAPFATATQEEDDRQ